MIKLYKEGQGVWSRGVLAFLIGFTGIFATVRSYQWIEAEGAWEGGLPIGVFLIPYRAFIGLLLVPFVVTGIWLYNHRRLADFLIDTESELKNKVTWPTRREATYNSIVVVVTCVILGVWIVFADAVLRQIKEIVYGIGG